MDSTAGVADIQTAPAQVETAAVPQSHRWLIALAVMLGTSLEVQQLAMAVWGMGLMVAPILGPTLGGWITDNWSWRWNFYINLPIGMIAIAMVSAFVHDPHYLAGRKGRKVDYAGMLLLVVAL